MNNQTTKHKYYQVISDLSYRNALIDNKKAISKNDPEGRYMLFATINHQHATIKRIVELLGMFL